MVLRGIAAAGRSQERRADGRAGAAPGARRRRTSRCVSSWQSPTSDDAVLGAARARVLPIIEQRGQIRALIIDDTGLPKKGKHSVGWRGSNADISASRTTARSR
jgi:SRSO17 transposase